MCPSASQILSLVCFMVLPPSPVSLGPGDCRAMLAERPRQPETENVEVQQPNPLREPVSVPKQWLISPPSGRIL